eukprot:g3571.t1
MFKGNSSKICQRFELIRNRRIHEQKLNEIGRRKRGTGTLDNKAPKTTRMKHLKNKAKKEQMLEEQFSRIEKENRLLLKKMTEIMSQPPAYVKKQRKTPAFRSLNTTHRRREILRINQENQALMKRIKSVKPQYDHKVWERQSKVQHNYAKSISNFQPDTWLYDLESVLSPRERQRRKQTPGKGFNVLHRISDKNPNLHSTGVVHLEPLKISEDSGEYVVSGTEGEQSDLDSTIESPESYPPKAPRLKKRQRRQKGKKMRSLRSQAIRPVRGEKTSTTNASLSSTSSSTSGTEKASPTDPSKGSKVNSNNKTVSPSIVYRGGLRVNGKLILVSLQRSKKNASKMKLSGVQISTGDILPAYIRAGLDAPETLAPNAAQLQEEAPKSHAFIESCYKHL